MTIEPNDPSLNDAAALLAKMEAEENAADKATAIAPPDSGSASQPDRAGQGTTEQVPSTNLPDSKGGTPADKEPQKPQDQPADKPADDPKESRYAKSQKRLNGNWDQYHADRKALTEQQEAFKRQQEALIAERKQIEDERQKLNQPKYKPDDYENAARHWTAQAMQLNAQAEKLEEAGKYDEADKVRDQAKALRNQSNQAKQQAEYLRANPPKPTPTAEQAQQEFESKRKEWYGKAVTDFPAFKDKNSAEFKKLTAILTKGAEGYDPMIEQAVNQSPEGMYYAARLVVAETLAASVAQKDKELVELRAKVKELDERSAIPTDAVAHKQAGEKSDDEMTDEELEASVKEQARRMSR